MNKILDIKPEDIKRILVCQLRQIGDVLLTTPAIRLLGERFPKAKIHFFTEKKCLPMLEHNPFIHKIWTVHRDKGMFSQLSLYRQIAKNNYDIIVDFQQLPRCKQLLTFCRANIRISFPPPWYNKFFYTHWHGEPEIYAAQSKADMLRPLGIKWEGQQPELYLTPAETAEALDLLQDNDLLSKGPLFTIDPAHNRETRRWPYYAKLLDILAKNIPNSHFMLCYGPGEKELVDNIKATAQCADRIFVPQKMLSLRQMAACMHYATLHIGNCSSPRHIAVAVGLPSVTILGSTSPIWTFPGEGHLSLQKELPCQPCNKNVCPYGTPPCLYDLSAEEVAKKVMNHFNSINK